MFDITFLSHILWGLSFLFTAYVSYYFLMALASLGKRKAYPAQAPKTKFAVVIAARNEGQVIGNLVESLLSQSYPRELFDVIVAPNNCTDDTEEAARQAGARIFNCRLPVRSKGQVLTQVFDQLLTESYDAFCVFDADNLVDPQFLAQMNNAVSTGVRLAQGYRDSKNPHDTPISGCYSIYYWMINRFYSAARSRLGLSAIINGSGFMVTAPLLAEMGGWHTSTMTEDIEFTTQCLLRGQRVAWVPDAITYDEQPLTFAQSWTQRKRWSTGLLQGAGLYLKPLVRRALAQRDMACLDQAIFYLTPALQLVMIASMVLTALLNLWAVSYQLFPANALYFDVFVALNYSFFTSAATSLAIVLLEKKAHRGIVKGILFYWVFIMSWLPINLMCLFRKHTTWDQIQHTRSLKLGQLGT